MQENPASSLFARAEVTRLGLLLGRTLPPRFGLLISRSVACAILVAEPAMVRNARANLRHVVPPETAPSELDRILRCLIFNAVRGYYHFFHNINSDPTDVYDFRPPVKAAPELFDYFSHAQSSGRGLFLLATHMSNFDLGGLGLSHYAPLPLQALTIADPPPGFEVVNDLRSKGRGIITPVSPASLRAAVERLRAGGVVFTAVDRPLSEGNEPVDFFGATAYLPTGYMRIPLMTDCLMMAVSFLYDGRAYWILGNPPMEVRRTGDRRRDVIYNVKRVLDQIEDFIRVAPDQWMVFNRVWPDE